MADFIKEGGYCVTAGGEKVGPMLRERDGAVFLWYVKQKGKSANWSWTADGRYSVIGTSPERDLVAEWVEPAPTADGPHPSHVLRASDASTFDVICERCGAHDQTPGGWGNLVYPCNAASADAPTVASPEPDYERLATMWQAYLHGRDISPKDARAMLRILEIIQEDDNG